MSFNLHCAISFMNHTTKTVVRNSTVSQVSSASTVWCCCDVRSYIDKESKKRAELGFGADVSSLELQDNEELTVRGGKRRNINWENQNWASWKITFNHFVHIGTSLCFLSMCWTVELECQGAYFPVSRSRETWVQSDLWLGNISDLLTSIVEP